MMNWALAEKTSDDDPDSKLHPIKAKVFQLLLFPKKPKKVKLSSSKAFVNFVETS